MKKHLSFILASLLAITCIAQTEDSKTLYDNARSFMKSGDFDNAIIVLTRALQQDKNNTDMQKDLVMCYYLKRDYTRALDGVKSLLERDDADEVTYQLAGNIYKDLEQVKDCEKLYKKGLKKFPKSGPLYNEYGELLWAAKDFSAINQWEKGIQMDPAYAGNYYNAAHYYFYTKEKVWSLIYGEIFVNMESLTERAAAIKQLLLQGYKEKLFADADPAKEEGKTKSEFANAYLEEMTRLSPLANKGINLESLTMIRSRFILDWYAGSNASKFPFKLFDYQRQLLQEGMFEAYNEWLFGPVDNLPAYDNWTKTHSEQYTAFSTFQQSRVFKMPAGQYYQ